jgi:hypothetical protein
VQQSTSDGRARLLVLTERGEAVTQAAEPAAADVVSRWPEQLVVGEFQRLQAALRVIAVPIATARTSHQFPVGASPAHAFTSGFHRALFAECIFLLATALIALHTVNFRGEEAPFTGDLDATPEPAVVP